MAVLLYNSIAVLFCLWLVVGRYLTEAHNLGEPSSTLGFQQFHLKCCVDRQSMAHKNLLICRMADTNRYESSPRFPMSF